MSNDLSSIECCEHTEPNFLVLRNLGVFLNPHVSVWKSTNSRASALKIKHFHKNLHRPFISVSNIHLWTKNMGSVLNSVHTVLYSVCRVKYGHCTHEWYTQTHCQYWVERGGELTALLTELQEGWLENKEVGKREKSKTEYVKSKYTEFWEARTVQWWWGSEKATHRWP